MAILMIDAYGKRNFDFGGAIIDADGIVLGQAIAMRWIEPQSANNYGKWI